MTIKITIFLLFLSVLFMLCVLRLIKRNMIPPSSALLWFVMSLVFFSIPFFEKLYKYVASEVIGFQDSSHLIYIFMIGFLLLYSLYLTIKMKKASDKIQSLISFTAIIENELKSKIKKLDRKEKSEG